jgi:hypothetical protein
MRSLITSGSLTRGAKLNQCLDGTDTMPFPKENDVMMIYRGGHPPSGRCHMSNLSPRVLTHYGWGPGGSEV